MAVISAGASIISGNKQAKATKNATAQQVAYATETRDLGFEEADNSFEFALRRIAPGSQQQIDILNDSAGRQRAATTNFGGRAIDRLDGFARGGGVAQEALMSDLGLGEAPEGYEGFKGSEGYQFRRQQGLDAIEASAAARGGLFSGNTGAELARYGDGVAAQEFDNHVARLSALAGRGQAAAGQQAGIDVGIGDRLSGTEASRAFGVAGIRAANTDALVNAANNRSNIKIGVGSQANQRTGDALAQAALARGQIAANTVQGVSNGIQNTIGIGAKLGFF